MTRVLWVVVNKKAKKTRQPKSVSFNLTSIYEVGLLNYAEDPKHGDFSKYIKRLIDRDMREGDRQENFTVQQTAATQVHTEPEMQTEDSDIMSGFL
ncbi:hypothetical protein [Sporosarcina sp. FSL W7-1283]|uniref:hypothetical protein n=1 Tax=Sporosarcina sp. FSL W7-1283 TaxID=2921560 RepID=UPI0030F9833B